MLSFGYDGVVLYVFDQSDGVSIGKCNPLYSCSCQLVLLLVSAVCFCVW